MQDDALKSVWFTILDQLIARQPSRGYALANTVKRIHDDGEVLRLDCDNRLQIQLCQQIQFKDLLTKEVEQRLGIRQVIFNYIGS